VKSWQLAVGSWQFFPRVVCRASCALPSNQQPATKVKGREISSLNADSDYYISLTDMIKAKDGDFFIADWLRNRNTIELLGIWEKISNPRFNYGEFAIIKSKAGLNNFRISAEFKIYLVKEFQRLKEEESNHLNPIV
jgi:hypothetical protein